MKRDYTPIPHKPIRANAIRSLFVQNVEGEVIGIVTATDPVEDDEASGRQVVRGVFSASQLEIQTGLPVTPSVGVLAFSEIREALARP